MELEDAVAAHPYKCLMALAMKWGLQYSVLERPRVPLQRQGLGKRKAETDNWSRRVGTRRPGQRFCNRVRINLFTRCRRPRVSTRRRRRPRVSTRRRRRPRVSTRRRRRPRVSTRRRRRPRVSAEQGSISTATGTCSCTDIALLG